MQLFVIIFTPNSKSLFILKLDLLNYSLKLWMNSTMNEYKIQFEIFTEIVEWIFTTIFFSNRFNHATIIFTIFISCFRYYFKSCWLSCGNIYTYQTTLIKIVRVFQHSCRFCFYILCRTHTHTHKANEFNFWESNTSSSPSVHFNSHTAIEEERATYEMCIYSIMSVWLTIVKASIKFFKSIIWSF